MPILAACSTRINLVFVVCERDLGRATTTSGRKPSTAIILHSASARFMSRRRRAGRLRPSASGLDASRRRAGWLTNCNMTTPPPPVDCSRSHHKTRLAAAGSCKRRPKRRREAVPGVGRKFRLCAADRSRGFVTLVLCCCCCRWSAPSQFARLPRPIELPPRALLSSI